MTYKFYLQKAVRVLFLLWVTLALLLTALRSSRGEESEVAYVDGAASTSTSISDLVATAVARNPGIAAMDQRIEATRGAMIQAGLPLNPNMELYMEEIGAGGTAGEQGILVEQEFRTANKRGLAVCVEQWALEVLTWQRRAVSGSVKNEVAIRTINLLAARRLIAVRAHLLELAETTERQSDSFLKAGEISEMNFLQLKVQAREAKLALTQAKNDCAAAEKELAALLLCDPTQLPAQIEESLEALCGAEPLDEDRLLDSLLENNPVLNQTRTVVRQRQAELSLAQAEARSNVTLGGGIAYDSEEETTVAAAGFAMPLRVYDRNQGNIKSAQGRYAAALRDVESAELTIKQQLARVFQNWVNAREEVLVYRNDILPALERSWQMTFQAFQSSEAGYLEMYNSQVTYFQSAAQYIASLRRLASVRILLDGNLLEGDMLDDADLDGMD
ncbi:MAG: TolC family protein [Planctomycetia bacterium]|nr:TolC family protein [Planctomycetia bacterium]